MNLRRHLFRERVARRRRGPCVWYWGLRRHDDTATCLGLSCIFGRPTCDLLGEPRQHGSGQEARRRLSEEKRRHREFSSGRVAV